MKRKPSLEEFRGGSSEDAAAAITPMADATTVIQRAPERISKTIRIRKSFESKLKEHAFHCSQAEGRRITESDVIDDALEFYWAHKK